MTLNAATPRHERMIVTNRKVARMLAAVATLSLALGPLSVAAVTTGDAINAAANVNAAIKTDDDGKAIEEVRAAAEQTAKSSELQGAVKSIWRLSWDRSWPFIRDTAAKFWGLMKQAWSSLTSVGKSSQTGTNGNVNAAANVNASAGTNAAN
jgi:hypothetical protein